MKKFLFLFLTLLLISGNSLWAQTPKGEFTDLGAYTNAQGISPNGDYLITYMEQKNEKTSKLWMRDGSELILGEPADEARVWGVSDNGIVVGNFNDPELIFYESGVGNFLHAAGYYKDGKWHGLGIRDGVEPHRELSSNAQAISPDGTLIGGQHAETAAKYHPVIWKDGEYEEYEIGNHDSGKINSISADGRIMAGRVSGYRYPAIWIDKKLKVLRYNDQVYSGEVYQISPNGKYAAGYINIAGSQPFLYDVEKDVITLIGTENGEGCGVSNDGMLVGYYQSGGFFGIPKAFIYNKNMGMMLLTDYAEMLGIDIPDSKLDRAEFISADGSRIMGTNNPGGLFPPSYSNAWVLDINEHFQGVSRPGKVTLTESPDNFRNMVLAWEEAEVITSYTMVGYNIYRDTELLNDTPVNGLTYTDETELENGKYTYYVTAVWESQGSEKIESKPSEPVVTNIGGMTMPFIEKFDSGSYDTNYWNISPYGSGNWYFSTIDGLYEPCVAFSAPKMSEYRESFISPYVDARNSTELYASFSYGATMTGAADLQTLLFEVYDGENWNVAKEFKYTSNKEDLFYARVNISEWGAGKQTRVRFTAVGKNESYSIKWAVDNIRIYDVKDEVVESAPVNFKALRKEDGTVLLTWENIYETAVLGYGATPFPVGLARSNNGAPIIYSHMFDQKDLAAFHGYSLVNIEAFLTTTIEDGMELPEFSLAVFSGDERLVTQPIGQNDYEIMQWNKFDLETPVVIDSTKPLYIGIEMTRYEDLDRAMGMANILDNDGKSNLLSVDGGKTWFANDEQGAKQIPFMIRALAKKDIASIGDKYIMGYGVYREGVGIMGNNEVWFNNMLTDEEAPDEATCYQVDVFYLTQGWSSQAKECVKPGVSIEDNEMDNAYGIEVFPNPASYIINVKGEFISVSLYDMDGKHITTTDKSEFNVESLPRGVYMLNIETPSGTTLRKVVIR